MKKNYRLLVRVACAMLTLATASLVRADFPQQRKSLDELQAAKSAKDHIANANKGNKGGRQGRRSRQDQ